MKLRKEKKQQKKTEGSYWLIRTKRKEGLKIFLKRETCSDHRNQHQISSPFIKFIITVKIKNKKIFITNLNQCSYKMIMRWKRLWTKKTSTIITIRVWPKIFSKILQTKTSFKMRTEMSTILNHPLRKILLKSLQHTIHVHINFAISR